MNDPISDLIIRIKNTSMAGKDSASIPHSKLKLAVAEILKREGYIKSVSSKGKDTHKTIEIGILYDENHTPKVKGVSRVSKLSKRVYMGVKDIRPVKYGYGLLLLSTPKGILTDKEARKENVGGEALFKIW